MAVRTENGWYQIPASQCSKSLVPGTNVWVPAQAGVVNTVLKAFAADFNQYVEPLRQGDTGGWTPTNQVWNSNHLSGTAFDLNWNGADGKTFRYGISEERAFPPPKNGIVRELLTFYENLIFCGGFWSIRDWMHFQIGGNTYGTNKLQDFINRKITAGGFSTFKRDTVPVVATKPVVPGTGGEFWADVSQYQGKPIEPTYPYSIFCYRTNSGSTTDTLAAENTKRALTGLNDGRLKLVIAYYFFRPGQQNCDLHRKLLQDNGLWGHPRLITMVDVESDAGKITGDHSWEINDEIQRMRGWYGDMNRVIGYWNPNADPGLWLSRPYGLHLVMPQYSNPRSARTPGDLSTIRDRNAYKEAFAHQFTDQFQDCPPWTGGSGIDMNWSPHTVDELLHVFGIVTEDKPPVISPPTPDLPSGELPELPGHLSWEELRAIIGSQFIGGR